jgi:hypothetical protein
MFKKLLSILFSTRLMALLFLGFAAAMAAGTFIESYYNTDTARIWIYNAWWFELIMLFFMLNFFGNIKRYQLWKKEKWATLLVHLSFIFILLELLLLVTSVLKELCPFEKVQQKVDFIQIALFLPF